MQPNQIQSVAIFCGSRYGNRPAWREACTALGHGLAQAGIRLVYGGGQVGLMGVIADAVLEAGGEVLGIIPEFLQRREVAHQGPLALIVTDTMHDRKRRMFEAADAFVAMPGGLGTFDELVEVTTWRQLALHDKPIILCNIAGWADAYLELLENTVRNGFAASDALDLFEVILDVPTLLARLQSLARPPIGHPEQV